MIRGLLAVSLFISGSFAGSAFAETSANRLTYLDENEPFYVGRDFPKLTTPQWIGEPGAEAVVILAIDDMREPQKYETFLRPILDRLKQIDGRAPVSIMTCSIDAQSPRLQTWLKEGLSLEVHTLTHPCPLLSRSNFGAAAETYYGCIDLLNRIPGNRPVAFRMPCCDSINSPSPRFYAEIFNNTNALGQFLTLDSSVMNVTTTNDPALPRELTVDNNRKEKFRKYLPSPSFATAIEDYPYPYIIGKLCWEFPAMVPSDWESQNLQGNSSPVLLADWKAALDATVLKQGTFTMIFHPYGWSTPEQLVALIDYALNKYGNKVKFLNFREAEQRLNQNLTAEQPLRAINGQDNGIRLVDLNNDGFLDVVIANEQVRKTRVWRPTEKKWIETDFPTPLVTARNRGTPRDAGVRFGIVGDASRPVVIARNDSQSGAWRFEGEKWTANPALLNGLVLDSQPVFTAQKGCDRGARLRDVDGDGVDDLIIANESQNAVLAWTSAEQTWKRLPYSFPTGVAIVNAQGQDNGVRFVDLNEDGVDDLVFSNEKSYSVNLMVPTPVLGFQRGWSREIIRGNRGQMPEIPMIVRASKQRRMVQQRRDVRSERRNR